MNTELITWHRVSDQLPDWFAEGVRAAERAHGIGDKG